MADLPAASLDLISQPDLDALRPAYSQHKPRILILYGSLRKISFSRLLAEEAARLLAHFGCEVKIFNPEGLPLPDGAPDTDPKVQELRALSLWSEGHVWVSPERHGAMTGIIKAQIDWIPSRPVRCDRRRARRSPSCRSPVARNPSTRSISCAFSVAGCG